MVVNWLYFPYSPKGTLNLFKSHNSFKKKYAKKMFKPPWQREAGNFDCELNMLKMFNHFYPTFVCTRVWCFATNIFSLSDYATKTLYHIQQMETTLDYDH